MFICKNKTIYHRYKIIRIHGKAICTILDKLIVIIKVFIIHLIFISSIGNPIISSE